MTGLLQRVFQRLSRVVQFTYRDRQTFHADLESRRRVVVATFGCRTCRKDFASFAELRAHACRPSVQG
jgi:hypothetical protein